MPRKVSKRAVQSSDSSSSSSEEESSRPSFKHEYNRHQFEFNDKVDSYIHRAREAIKTGEEEDIDKALNDLKKARHQIENRNRLLVLGDKHGKAFRTEVYKKDAKKEFKGVKLSQKSIENIVDSIAPAKPVRTVNESNGMVQVVIPIRSNRFSKLDRKDRQTFGDEGYLTEQKIYSPFDNAKCHSRLASSHNQWDRRCINNTPSSSSRSDRPGHMLCSPTRCSPPPDTRHSQDSRAAPNNIAGVMDAARSAISEADVPVMASNWQSPLPLNKNSQYLLSPQ